MLLAEGLANAELGFEGDGTWILEDEGELIGFFSLRTEHGYPYLTHFCVAKSKREHSTARRLVAELKSLLKSRGHSRIIINVPTDNEYVVKMVTTYFRTQPYAERDAHKFFLTEV
jgi:NADH:ubiquinone oxidoreductase subunit C